MNKPNSPQKSPYRVELEEGQKYAFCTCGLSEKKPYCDGAHRAYNQEHGDKLGPIIVSQEDY